MAAEVGPSDASYDISLHPRAPSRNVWATLGTPTHGRSLRHSPAMITIHRCPACSLLVLQRIQFFSSIRRNLFLHYIYLDYQF